MMKQIFAIIGLILLSAFFSGSEIAFASCNPARLKSAKGQKATLSGRAAVYIYNHYNNALATILIGNNLVNIAASSIATVLVIALFLGNRNFSFVATIIMTLLILTFGEILPKIMAKRKPETFAKAAAVPILLLLIILSPVIFIINRLVAAVSVIWKKQVSDTDSVSEDDLENIIDIVEDEGVLDEEQCDLLQNALNFNDVLAYEVVTPRVDMVGIDIHDSFEKNLNILENSPYSRIPVFEDSPDKIIGVLHLNRFYKQLVESGKKQIEILPLLIEPLYVHKTMPLPDVLEKMKNEKHHLAVVLDEYGGTLGILTMEDVLEQLVGEIWDESDEIVEEFTCIDENHYTASGDMRIYDFFDEFDIDIEDTDAEEDNVTLGGFATQQLDGEVFNGADFVYEQLKFTVLDYDNMRIERLAIEVLETEETTEA